MNGITLTWVTILLPFAGALLALFLSQLEDYAAAEGKTRSWILVIFIMIPTAVISLLLLWHMHLHESQYFLWLPNLYLGIRINELSVGFACLINSLSALLGLYSINYLSGDRNQTNYWFFFLITQGGMLFAFFSNNLLWMFLGFAIASLGGFFLVSHWRNKSGEEGEKVGKAAMRFFIFNFIGDIFLIIGIAFIGRAFNTLDFERLMNAWIRTPVNIIGATSSNTRLLIGIFIVVGALIKSAQFPLLLWPLSGEKNDADLAKAPLPISSFLVSVTLGNIGLYIICAFFPMFSNKGLEVHFETELFNSIPFVIIGWAAIATMITCLVVIFTAKNINRIMIGASLFQVSLTFLALSAANELGYLATIYHLILGSAASVALTIIFGMVVESLRVKQITRVSGLRKQSPILQILGFISILSYVGMFPFSTYFSRDMIFEALRTSIVPTSMALLILAMIGTIVLIFAVGKSLMKVLFGETNEEYSVRPIRIESMVSEILVLLWTCFAGFILIIVGTPSPRFFRGVLQKNLDLGYDFPIFSNWAISMIMFAIIPLVIAGTFFAYRDGIGKIFTPIRNFKGTKMVVSAIENGLYLEKVNDYLILKPMSFLSNYITWTRLKAPAGIILWAVLSFVILVSILFTGGA
ncbi:MAG: proton-conducting transporter transmembrane domain-containing protein [Candidatus Heimdallarchaeota archaeon]